MTNGFGCRQVFSSIIHHQKLKMRQLYIFAGIQFKIVGSHTLVSSFRGYNKLFSREVLQEGQVRCSSWERLNYSVVYFHQLRRLVVLLLLFFCKVLSLTSNGTTKLSSNNALWTYQSSIKVVERESDTRFFVFRFFSWISFPRAPEYPFGTFRIFTGVNDTGNELLAVSLLPAINYSRSPCHRWLNPVPDFHRPWHGRWKQLQIRQLAYTSKWT